MQTKKQQKWRKRPLNILLATVLVASSVSFVGTPQKVKAAPAAGPGGVSNGLISWIDVERSAEITTGNTIDTLTDLVDGKSWGPYSKTKNVNVPNALNFNGGLNFTGSNSTEHYTRLQTDIGPINDDSREVFSVQASNGYGGFPWEFGGRLTTANSPAVYGVNNGKTIRTYFGRESGHLDSEVGDYELKNGAILNVWSAKDDWALSLNGKTLSISDMNTPLFDSPVTAPGFEKHYYFGAGHGSRFKGKVSETILFNRKLDVDERKRVNSYLALKYGLTLKDDYIASDGSTTMWTATNNTGYGNHITGIGRDDNGALYQKQSKSQVNGANITIALGDVIKATNAENLNTITNDKTFFTFSDNGVAATYDTIIENANLPATLAHENSTTSTTKMMERVFKVEKSATWADQKITFNVDEVDLNNYKYHLFVNDSDSAFPKATTTAYPVDQTTGTVTLNSDKLKNGSYFTFVQHVNKTDLETLVNAIDAENLKKADYPDTTWTTFEQALADAKSILTNPDKTATEIDAALTALNNARQALQPLEVKTPGGIDTNKLSLWVKADSVATDENVTSWKDETNANQYTAQGTPKISPSSVNFNPSVTFDGFSYLVGDKSITMAEAFTVAMWNGNKNGPTGQITKGTIISSTERKVPGDNAMYFFWNKSDENKLYAGASPYNSVPSPADNVYNLWNAAQGVFEKDSGNIGGTVGNNPTFTGIPQIGKRNNFTNDKDVSNMNGNIAEIITLKAKADATERSKVDSYLALKYGITLNNGASNYVDTNNSTVWTIDTTYKNNIAGIARDDAEGLYQKQSHSINVGTQVVIGLDTLVATNAANNGTLTDKQYLVWGDNNAALKFTKQIGTTDKNHSERIWKVQNTGSVGKVDIAIPKASVPTDTTLLVGNSDTDFTNATSYQMPTEMTAAGTEYYVTKATLANGQYFTFAADAPKPVSAVIDQAQGEGNQITLTFNQDVALTDGTGFTITVGSNTIEGATFTVDPTDAKKVIITLPDGTDITGKEITVKYDATLGNLKGTSGVPVSNFKESIVNKAALQAEVEKAADLNKSDYTADTWAAYQKELAKAQAVLDNDNATQAEVDAAKATLAAAREALQEKPGVVNKAALQAEVGKAAGLNESDYTADTWTAYQKEIVKAQAVLGNDNATQAEVDAAEAALAAAREALQVVPGIVNKAALQAEVGKAAGLNESNYTADTWTAYQKEIVKAQAILGSDNATQAEVDAAEVALAAAREALQVVPGIVNKAALQAEVGKAAGLNESNYTADTWAAYQKELAKAQAVLGNDNATQAEVDAAEAALAVARKALQEKPGVVNKAALQAEVGKAAGLTESDYTAETWATYQKELTKAQAVLGNDNATQAEVDAAEAALAVAREALQEKPGVVNKAPLQAKVDEAKGLVASKYTPETWANYQNQLVAAQKVLDDADATQAEVNKALADLTAAKNALRPVLTTPGLGSLVPSQGALSPSFSSEVTNYTMNVDYATSQLSFLATPINQGASVTTTVNGQPGTIGQIPLQVGENIIVITVTDSNGSVRHYTIKVYREAYTGSGGGTWTPNPTPPPTTETGTTTTKIQVALEIDGDNPLEKTTVEIERTKHANGEITDFVALTEANAKEAVEKAKQIGNNIARIVIPDVKDEVDKVTVEIPKQSLQLLRENGLSLEISTENGHIAIPLSSMNGVDNNFYFRLVPVKKESERKAIEERARVEKVVRETLQSNDVHVVARPMTIETNMPSRPVQVTLPLRGVKVPTAAAERQEFLDQLAVFIEHSDGEKKVVFPEVVTMAKGELGLRFTVDKFSTFTVIQFEKPTVGKHEAYIKGFPNGTFGPEKNVTRAQVATMIARILGYTDDQTVDYAPFNDIPSNHYAAGAIAFVKERGIMNGDMNGNFRASENITRAQMATVVANYKHLQIEEGVEITFNDTKGHWAQWIIEANRTAGIINGRQDGNFAPNEHLTRAQAVVMMNRMFERGPLNGVRTPSFLDVKATHWAFKEIEEAAKSHSYVIDEDDHEQLSK